MISAVVEKRHPDGSLGFRYDGQIVTRTGAETQFTGYFRVDVQKSYVHFRVGDRTHEYFYADRWYNILELHDVDDDRLKGWYCNIAHPAQVSETPDGALILYVDLALDVFVFPDGRTLLLDEDELEAMNLDAALVAQAYRAVDDLREHVTRREIPFDQMKANP